MKGVILAGGLGTRLYPLTHVTNKHLLPIYNKPMIFYPIQTLVKAGITHILVITSGPHVGHYLGVLKNGKELGVEHLEYAYQEKADGGIADALNLARDFADNDNLAVILGDNTTDADISDDVKSFKSGAKIFLKEVPDAARYGVPIFDKDDPSKIIAIQEKPEHPQSNYAVTGLYLYDHKVFEYINQIKPSSRGQLEITDVNNAYITAKTLHWAKLNGFWSDAGTFKSLFHASQFWAMKDRA